MTTEILTSITELHSRFSDGIQVRLLWCRHDGRVWVSVIDTKGAHSFRVRVHDGEQPLDVFHHPFAYAAHHGVMTEAAPPAELEIAHAA